MTGTVGTNWDKAEYDIFPERCQLEASWYPLSLLDVFASMPGFWVPGEAK